MSRNCKVSAGEQSGLMDNKEFLDIVEGAIDLAFKGQFKLQMYEYLKSEKMTRRDVQEFIDGPTAQSMNLIIYDLEDYIEGGADQNHKQLREAYGFLGKPEARKIKNYLESILKDAWNYERDKRPGRKRKSSK